MTDEQARHLIKVVTGLDPDGQALSIAWELGQGLIDAVRTLAPGYSGE